VAFPTETVYGLGADALDEAAVRRVFKTKGRPSNNPLIVHVSGPAMARRVVAEWPRDAQLLADCFWPGPLSIILPKASGVPSVVTADGPNVAVRCPDHPLTLALLRALDGPLVGPSANPSGRISPTTAAHVRESFTPAQVYVLDGGPCTGGIESTVVKLGDEIRVLRAGLITPEAIARVLNRPVLTGSPLTATPESPGQLASHYAPLTPTRLIPASDLSRALHNSTRAAVLSTTDLHVQPPHTLFRMPTDPHAYARELYSALRQADTSGADRIIVISPAPHGASPEDASLWSAIVDRLTRASTPPTQ